MDIGLHRNMYATCLDALCSLCCTLGVRQRPVRKKNCRFRTGQHLWFTKRDGQNDDIFALLTRSISPQQRGLSCHERVMSLLLLVWFEQIANSFAKIADSPDNRKPRCCANTSTVHRDFSCRVTGFRT